MALNGTDNICANTAVSYELNMFRLIVLIPSCVVVITCSCVLYVLLKIPELRDITNALIINSAVADLIRGLIGLLNTYLYIRPLPATDVNFDLCQVFLFFHLFQGFWSSWSLCALAYDRYDLLAHPIRRKLKAKQVGILIATILTLDALLCSFPLFGWSEYLFYRFPNNPELAKCRISQQETNLADWAFLPTFDICAYILPCIITIVIYAKILNLVLQHIRKRQEVRSRHQNTVHGLSRSTGGIGMSVISTVQMKDRSTDQPTLSAHQSVAPPHTNSEVMSTPLLVIKSKAFRLVTVVIATNMLLTLPFVIVLELEKFRVIIIKVFPDVMKSILMALFNCNFVFNSVVYVFWVRNAVRVAAERGFRRRGLVTKFVSFCCLKTRRYNADAV